MLTDKQETMILLKIEEIRRASTNKLALHKNDVVCKFLNMLNAFGFLTAEKYRELDERRYCALMKIDYRGKCYEQTLP